MQEQRIIDELDLARLRFCACGNLRMATRAVTQLFDEAFQSTGLRATQLNLLIVIALFGPATITRLAGVIIMDRTTLTRNLNPLQKQGLVKILPGEDRRTREVELTTRGQEAVAKALPLWEKAQAQIVKGLGQKRFDSLLADLSEVVSLAR